MQGYQASHTRVGEDGARPAYKSTQLVVSYAESATRKTSRAFELGGAVKHKGGSETRQGQDDMQGLHGLDSSFVDRWRPLPS